MSDAHANARPDVRPIYDNVDRAMQEELGKWTYDLPEEFHMALSRAVVKSLQESSMLNFDRPWEDECPSP